MSTTLYHGTHRTDLAAHAGQCWTDDETSATTYAGHGRTAALWTVTVDLSALVVETVTGYDRDADSAPGDSASSRAALAASGVDVVVYQDEDEAGSQHETVRLVSARAVAMVAAAMYECEIG